MDNSRFFPNNPSHKGQPTPTPPTDQPYFHPSSWNMSPGQLGGDMQQNWSNVPQRQTLLKNSAGNLIKKRKVADTDLLGMAELEYSEYRVSKMSSIEAMAKEQFFEDSGGFLWDDKEEEIMATDLTSGGSANDGHGLGSQGEEIKTTNQGFCSGRAPGPVKTAFRRSHSK